MACTPLSIQAGKFDDNSQEVWNNFNESPAPGKSAAYSGGTLTVTGPNGSTFFTPTANQEVRHRFFGTSNFMAVLLHDTNLGLGTRSLLIVDFTAPSLTSLLVLQVNADSTNSLPFLQNSLGNGAACCIGAATSSGVAGLAILRSDTARWFAPARRRSIRPERSSARRPPRRCRSSRAARSSPAPARSRRATWWRPRPARPSRT